MRRLNPGSSHTKVHAPNGPPGEDAATQLFDLESPQVFCPYFRALRYNRNSMDPARIAEILRPFLAAPPVHSDAFHPEKRNDAGHPEDRNDTCHPEEGSDSCHPEERSDEGPAVLSPAQLQHISTYIDILVRWNARINLTAIRDPEDVVARHFGESLFAASRLLPASFACKGLSVADVGSGAGFPGLPLKLWAPDISLTLIEASHKKSAFLKEVARALTLTDINIQTARAQTIAARYALVTLRAVERFESILPTAAALVAPAGRLALLISSVQDSRARAILPDFQWRTPIAVPESHSRILLVANRTA